MIFVVAEIGVNWDGDIELAQDMMIHAKNSGCNAVKFQAFNSDILGAHPQKQRLLRASISKDNIESINTIARSVKIEWFCTPMYEAAVSMLDPFVNRFKIRHSDGTSLLQNKSTKLFEKIIKTGKEIVVSVNENPKDCKYYDYEKIKWLYVIPKYPCDAKDIDFSNITDYDGYSNHYPHVIAPLTAAIKGAKIIEVHITSDKSKDFVDNPVSINYTELENLVELIRDYEKII